MAQFHGGQVGGFFWKRHEMPKLAKLRVKRVAEKIAVGGVERTVAEAVIRALEGNHPALAGGQQRRFERGLNGFKTGIAKNDLARFFAVAPTFKRDPAQFAGEFGLARVRMHVAHGVQQPGHLYLPGLDDARICVTGGGNAKRGGQIEIFFPVGVPNVNVLGAFPNDRPGAVRFHEHNVARLVVAQQVKNLTVFAH